MYGLKVIRHVEIVCYIISQLFNTTPQIVIIEKWRSPMVPTLKNSSSLNELEYLLNQLHDKYVFKMNVSLIRQWNDENAGKIPIKIRQEDYQTC